MQPPPKGGLARTLTFANGGLVRIVNKISSLAGGNWKVLYTDGSGDVTELALGAANTVLTSNGAAAAPSFAAVSNMLKTAGGGYFLIPAGPAAGTSIATAANDTYSSWVAMIASTSAALYIVGLSIGSDDADIGTTTKYVQVDLGTGGAGAETSIGEWKIGLAGQTDAGYFSVGMMFPFPIPVAISTRIAARIAQQNNAAITWELTLICINQADLVAI